MEIKVYDRRTQQMRNESQFKKKHLDFLYQTVRGRVLLKLVTRKCFSDLYAIHLNSKRSVRKIQPFIEKNNLDMSDYEAVPYHSFNDFFARKIKPNKRPMDMDEKALISVADAKLMVYEINAEVKMNIKNSTYSINDLIQDELLAKAYQKGTCLVFRLTVDDYHRYHYVDDGSMKWTKSIKGILHTVGPISAERHDVYIENQREVSLLETAHMGEVLQVEVGALLVGKITNHKATTFKKGDEKGFFSFGGSTILLLFKEGVIQVDRDILELSNKGIETKIRMGEKIGSSLI